MVSRTQKQTPKKERKRKYSCSKCVQTCQSGWIPLQSSQNKKKKELTLSVTNTLPTVFEESQTGRERLQRIQLIS